MSQREETTLTNSFQMVDNSRPYHAPTLTRLGPIHSLVLANPGIGADGGQVAGDTLS
jgi:hypothetical protein